MWELVAHALAQLLHTWCWRRRRGAYWSAAESPRRRPELLEPCGGSFWSLNGYLKLDGLTGGIDDYAVPPGLGSLAGPLGALALAADTI